MGPGLLAALSGNDAGGIANLFQCWRQLRIRHPVDAARHGAVAMAVQVHRGCGCVTGKGFALLIREKSTAFARAPSP